MDWLKKRGRVSILRENPTHVFYYMFRLARAKDINLTNKIKSKIVNYVWKIDLKMFCLIIGSTDLRTGKSTFHIAWFVHTVDKGKKGFFFLANLNKHVPLSLYLLITDKIYNSNTKWKCEFD